MTIVMMVDVDGYDNDAGMTMMADNVDPPLSFAKLKVD